MYTTTFHIIHVTEKIFSFLTKARTNETTLQSHLSAKLQQTCMGTIKHVKMSTVVNVDNLSTKPASCNLIYSCMSFITTVYIFHSQALFLGQDKIIVWLMYHGQHLCDRCRQSMVR